SQSAGAGKAPFRDELPCGVNPRPFYRPGAGRVIELPRPARSAEKGPVSFALRAGLFAVNWLLRIFYYISFTAEAVLAARAACRESGTGFQVIAAYGYMAVPAARYIAWRQKAPLVVRLFGVSLGIKGFSRAVKIAQFEETLSFKLRADRWVITNDGSGGNIAAGRLGVPSSRVLHLINGVEKSRGSVRISLRGRTAYRRKYGLEDETKIVLRVARLWAQQRIDRMLRALPARLPDGTPVAAVIVGQGPEREYLKKLSLELGVRAVFTGPLMNSELHEHYLCSDLYAATGDRTNMSNSVLEALSCGLPVVALAAGQTGELIRDGVNGRLVPLAEINTLLEIVTGILVDEKLRDKLSTGASQTADELIPSLEERMTREADAFCI
ncbi:MAG: glycosyltransferase family 4 protein, partial [Gemmatimonadota bacterium]|nr:glycosyltransferase family 4 protein [Gemmatimonadota bacterium]